MAIPEAVRKAAAQADEFLKRDQSTENTEKSTLNTDDPDKTQNPEAQPEKTETEKAEEKNTQASTAESKKTETEKTASEETWEQRYKTLQGKFNAEVPGLRQRIKDLEHQLQNSADNGEEVSNLKAEVARLQKQIGSVAAKPSEEISDEVLEKLRYDHGADLVDGLLSVLDKKLTQSVTPIAQQVQSIGQETEKTRAETAQQSAHSRLQRNLQQHNLDLDTMNNDQFFIDWLDNIDEFAGVTRKKLLNAAYQSGDTERAAKFFIAYSQEQKPTTSANPKTPSKKDPPVTVTGSSSGDPSHTEDQPVVNTAAIRQQTNDLYAKKRRGEISEAEFKRLEQELFASIARYSSQ